MKKNLCNASSDLNKEPNYINFKKSDQIEIKKTK